MSSSWFCWVKRCSRFSPAPLVASFLLWCALMRVFARFFRSGLCTFCHIWRSARFPFLAHISEFLFCSPALFSVVLVSLAMSYIHFERFPLRCSASPMLLFFCCISSRRMLLFSSRRLILVGIFCQRVRYFIYGAADVACFVVLVPRGRVPRAEVLFYSACICSFCVR